MISATNEFHAVANGPVRPLDWDLKISWTKNRNTELDWFTLDQSKLGGADLLADNDQNPLQLWDAYDYESERERVISASVSNSIKFPYNVQSAILDITLDNHDGRYSFSEARGQLSRYILPARPARLYLGFRSVGKVPQFVGLTQALPQYEGQNDNVAKITAMDFLSEIGNQGLRQMLRMRDVRTDEVIAAILEQFGMTSQMFNLDQGYNVIPFVSFEKGENAGHALQALVQAENGHLWLDEQGIIRFANRVGDLNRRPVMVLNSSNVAEVTPSRESDIVNKVTIKSEVRQIQGMQAVYSVANDSGYSSDSDSWRIPANGTLAQWLNFEDPVWDTTTPVLNGPATSSFFRVLDLGGDPVSSGVTCSLTVFNDSAKVEFTNTTASPVSVSYLELWGTPAKVVDVIDYEAYDSASVEKFGEHELNVTDNNFFGSYRSADQFAENILQNMANYNPTIELDIKGDPTLQIYDVVEIDLPKYSGTWQIVGITNTLSASGLSTQIQAQRFTLSSAFILNRSQLNGTDVLS